MLGLPAQNNLLHGGYGRAQRGVRYKDVEGTGNQESRGKEQDVLKDKIARRIKRAEVTEGQDILYDMSQECVGRWQLHLNS